VLSRSWSASSGSFIAACSSVEASIEWTPVQQWQFNASGNYIHSYFYETAGGSSGSVLSDHQVGDPLDFASKYTFSVGAQHNFELYARPGFVRADYSVQGPMTYRLRTIGPWFHSESDVINMLSFRASLQWTPSVSFGVFARNLLNDRGLVDAFAIDNSAARSQPRTGGIDFSVKLD